MTSWNPNADPCAAGWKSSCRLITRALARRVPQREEKHTVIAMLLDEQKIVPILDGLDEMPHRRQRGGDQPAERGIRRSCPKPPPAGCTCRTDDYLEAVGDPQDGWIRNPVAAAAAIELHGSTRTRSPPYLANAATTHGGPGSTHRLTDLTVHTGHRA